MTEQSEITVTFKIVELLHIHDQLLISYDYGDDKELINYLMNRIIEQVPDFEESEDFAKLLIP